MFADVRGCGVGFEPSQLANDCPMCGGGHYHTKQEAWKGGLFRQLFSKVVAEILQP